MAKVAKDVDEYISGTPGEVQVTLRESIYYQIPYNDY
jgi:hypothetical protein